MGCLEAAVLQTLWGASTPLTPAAVNNSLGDDLACTTVMTIRGRLCNMRLVTRTKAGRAFEYSPAVTEAAYLADRMSNELAGPVTAEQCSAGSLKLSNPRTQQR